MKKGENIFKRKDGRWEARYIHYKFVGYLELPSLGSRRNYREETRKGVAVEYVPNALPA